MFPAHAGMSRCYWVCGPAAGYVPRTRGDEPALMPPSGPLLMFPAHAGMSRATLPEVYASCNVPRTRGDEPPQLGGF